MRRIRSSQLGPRPRSRGFKPLLAGAGFAIALLLGGAVGYVVGHDLGARSRTVSEPLLSESHRARLLALVLRVLDRRPPDPRPAGRCEPEVVVVRFSLRAPEAHKVAIVGDFNGWGKDRTLLSEIGGDGIWRITLRLRPGTYQYAFLVDGKRWVPDPGALRKPDGFGGHNSVIKL
jgi:hypothetical protein